MYQVPTFGEQFAKSCYEAASKADGQWSRHVIWRTATTHQKDASTSQARFTAINLKMTPQ